MRGEREMMTREVWRAWLAVVVICLGAVGCKAPFDEGVLPHIVMFDEDGDAIDAADPGGGRYAAYDRLGDAEYAARVKDTVDSIKASGLDRVLIFVHGGLNEQPSTIDRAVDLYGDILESGSFPIFVNWQSNLISSYGDHLFHVRQGRKYKITATPLFPFYLLGDVGRSAMRLPVVSVGQAREAGQSVGCWELEDREALTKALGELERARRRDPATAIRIDRGTGTGDWFDLATVWSWITIPAKIVSGFIIDTAGTGSWAIMKRRVNLLFEQASDFDGTRSEREARGLVLLMEELAKLDIAVDLVSHSTGALVVDRLLVEASQRHHDNGAPFPAFRHIVYLAAADSIRRNFDATFGYLSHDERARVFHVMLHEDAELAEANKLDLAPRGSLLVWVDDFLDRPSSLLERTAGRADNLIAALFLVPQEFRSRVHVRILDEKSDDMPTKHAEFSHPCPTGGGFQFWEKTDWWRWWDPQGMPLPQPVGP